MIHGPIPEKVIARPQNADDIDGVLRLLESWGQPSNYEVLSATAHDRWVAVDGGEIVGILLARSFAGWDWTARYRNRDANSPAAFVAQLYVAESNRSKGVGSLMLATWLATLSSSDLPAVVRPDENDEFDARVRFFIRNGFRWLEPSVPGQEAWLMEWAGEGSCP